MNILLHACCGPCSIEVVKSLKQRGYNFTIYFSNSNIAPANEYEKRKDTLITWANSVGVTVIEDEYCPKIWKENVYEKTLSAPRNKRCKACYHLRLMRSAQYAKEHGFDALATTLSISPYQLTDFIQEELEICARVAGIKAFFEDYRPLYQNSVVSSREAGMYRQNYCGCLPSIKEAEEDRAERKAERKARKAKEKEEKAKMRALQEGNAQAVSKS